LVDAIVANPGNAPVSAREQLLYSAVGDWTARRGRLSDAHSAGLLAAGWSSDELFSASTVCALFCFYNAWVDNNGVALMTEVSYAASGQRLATGGYL
jgi:hypothetical protein